MAIAFDNSTFNGNSGITTTRTTSHTCSGSQRLLIVSTLGGQDEGHRISGVTYGGVALTKIGPAIEPGDNTYVNQWYLLNPASGANDVVITMSSSGFVRSDIASYSGVNQINQPDSSNTATQVDNASITISTTTVTDNSWTILSTSRRVETVAGTGSTQREEILFDSNAAITPAASYSMTVGGGDGGTDWGAVIVSFAPFIPTNRSQFL